MSLVLLCPEAMYARGKVCFLVRFLSLNKHLAWNLYLKTLKPRRGVWTFGPCGWVKWTKQFISFLLPHTSFCDKSVPDLLLSGISFSGFLTLSRGSLYLPSERPYGCVTSSFLNPASPCPWILLSELKEKNSETLTL